MNEGNLASVTARAHAELEADSPSTREGKKCLVLLKVLPGENRKNMSLDSFLEHG